MYLCMYNENFGKLCNRVSHRILTAHTVSFQSTFKFVLAPKFEEIPCTG